MEVLLLGRKCLKAEEDEYLLFFFWMPLQSFSQGLPQRTLWYFSQEQFNASHLVVTFFKNTVVQWQWCGIEVEFHCRDSYISVVAQVIPADFVKHFGILTDERCYINVRYCYTPLRKNVPIYSSGFTVQHLEIIVIADNNSKNRILNTADCADCSVFSLSVAGGRILIRRRNFLTMWL